MFYLALGYFISYLPGALLGKALSSGIVFVAFMLLLMRTGARIS